MKRIFTYIIGAVFSLFSSVLIAQPTGRIETDGLSTSEAIEMLFRAREGDWLIENFINPVFFSYDSYIANLISFAFYSIVVIAVVLVSWNIYSGIDDSRKASEVMGKKGAASTYAVRVSIASVLLLPVGEAGYGLLHRFFLGLVTLMIYFCGNVWELYVRHHQEHIESSLVVNRSLDVGLIKSLREVVVGQACLISMMKQQERESKEKEGHESISGAKYKFGVFNLTPRNSMTQMARVDKVCTTDSAVNMGKCREENEMAKKVSITFSYGDAASHIRNNNSFLKRLGKQPSGGGKLYSTENGGVKPPQDIAELVDVAQNGQFARNEIAEKICGQFTLNTKKFKGDNNYSSNYTTIGVNQNGEAIVSETGKSTNGNGGTKEGFEKYVINSGNEILNNLNNVFEGSLDMKIVQSAVESFHRKNFEKLLYVDTMRSGDSNSPLTIENQPACTNREDPTSCGISVFPISRKLILGDVSEFEIANDLRDLIDRYHAGLVSWTKKQAKGLKERAVCRSLGQEPKTEIDSQGNVVTKSCSELNPQADASNPMTKHGVVAAGVWYWNLSMEADNFSRLINAQPDITVDFLPAMTPCASGRAEEACSAYTALSRNSFVFYDMARALNLYDRAVGLMYDIGDLGGSGYLKDYGAKSQSYNADAVNLFDEMMGVGSNSVGARDFRFDNNIHPVVNIRRMGEKMLNWVREFFKKDMSKTKGSSSIIAPLFIAMILPALMMVYYIPLLPFLYWMGQIVGFAISVLLLFFSILFILLAHYIPDKDGVIGRQGQNYGAILAGGMSLPLMTFGLITVYEIMPVFGNLINSFFGIAALSLITGDHFMQLAGVLTLTFILVFFFTNMMKKVFSVPNLFAEKVLTYMGIQAPLLMNEFSNSIEAGTSGQFSQVAGSSQQVVWGMSRKTGAEIGKDLSDFEKQVSVMSGASKEAGDSNGKLSEGEVETSAMSQPTVLGNYATSSQSTNGTNSSISSTGSVRSGGLNGSAINGMVKGGMLGSYYINSGNVQPLPSVAGNSSLQNENTEEESGNNANGNMDNASNSNDAMLVEDKNAQKAKEENNSQSTVNYSNSNNGTNSGRGLDYNFNIGGYGLSNHSQDPNEDVIYSQGYVEASTPEENKGSDLVNSNSVKNTQEAKEESNNQSPVNYSNLNNGVNSGRGLGYSFNMGGYGLSNYSQAPNEDAIYSQGYVEASVPEENKGSILNSNSNTNINPKEDVKVNVPNASVNSNAVLNMTPPTESVAVGNVGGAGAIKASGNSATGISSANVGVNSSSGNMPINNVSVIYSGGNINVDDVQSLNRTQLENLSYDAYTAYNNLPAQMKSEIEKTNALTYQDEMGQTRIVPTDEMRVVGEHGFNYARVNEGVVREQIEQALYELATKNKEEKI